MSDEKSTTPDPDLTSFVEEFWDALSGAFMVQYFRDLESYFDPEFVTVQAPPGVVSGAAHLQQMLQLAYGYDLELLQDYSFTTANIDLAQNGTIALDSGQITNEWLHDGNAVRKSFQYLAAFRRTPDRGWGLYRLMISDTGVLLAMGHA